MMARTGDLSLAFAAELSNADPERLALAIARIAYPELETEASLSQLDEMAAIARERVAYASAGEGRAVALIEALQLDLGFRGNTEHYYDAANSYLNVVLERRTGLPILLSLILMAIGRRLGLAVEGAGYPNHFMARYEDEEGVWILDPFHGEVVKPDDVPTYFEKLFGQSVMRMASGDSVPEVPAAAWALRILNNLRMVYMNSGNLVMLAKVLDFMLLVEPGRTDLWQERGIVGYRCGELEDAARALRRYFFLTGHISIGTPGDSSAPTPPLTDHVEQHLWNLLEEIEKALFRWN
jgi:regulator of sirC expression with transglutaminase-like and TPR domain